MNCVECCFDETSWEVFANNTLSEYLRCDHPEGLKNVAICFAQPWVWQSWGALTDVVRAGRTGMEPVLHQSFFEYLSTHAEAQQIFSALKSFSGMAIVEALRT